MVKRLAIVGLLLAVLVAVPFSSASTDPIEAACADAHLWLSSAVPLDLLQFVCTIYDNGSPVVNEVGGDGVLVEQNSGTEKYGLAFHESGLPEETRQQLLLLLALWGQE